MYQRYTKVNAKEMQVMSLAFQTEINIQLAIMKTAHRIALWASGVMAKLVTSGERCIIVHCTTNDYILGL